MKLLKDKILYEGQGIGNSIVKVDNFLNHQIDVNLMEKIGEEFKERFKEEEVTKILTVEASGIAIAVTTSHFFGFPPVVYAKKATPSTMVEGFYSAKVKSFTKGTESEIRISKSYLSKEDKVLIIDDFLAHGEAAAGLISITEQAGAKVVGIGAVIEKSFQGGGTSLREKGYRVESLAMIGEIQDGIIKFL